MTILSVGLPLLNLLQTRTWRCKTWSIRSCLILELLCILLNYLELFEFWNINEHFNSIKLWNFCCKTGTEGLKGSIMFYIYINTYTFNTRLFNTHGQVLSDHHVQLSDHSFFRECSHKSSPSHASAALKRHFCWACVSRFAAFCRSSTDGSCKRAIW